MMSTTYVQIITQCTNQKWILDKWSFGYLTGWFVGGTGCTLQTLYAWLMRAFWYWYGWNP